MKKKIVLLLGAVFFVSVTSLTYAIKSAAKCALDVDPSTDVCPSGGEQCAC